MSTRWRATAALAAAACAAALLAAGCGSLRQIGAGSHSPPATTFTITARVTAVVVNGGASSVTVTGGDRGTVLVSQRLSYTKTPPATSRRLVGTTLTLSYSCPAQLVCGVAYDVQVPAAVAVTVDTRAGAVTLTALAGPVSAQTYAGLITAVNLSSRTAGLRSDVGGIDATFSAAPMSVSAATNIGPIALTLPDSASYKVSAHTYVGSSTVTVAKSAASSHVITVSSDLGSITISPA
ncbi:hypothetical protein [Trebonia sp.]|uniref:hypothetical protein n=1 Tax=Trebonia sp. TaxID=2767075 RepID=UPI00260E1E2D|nr:hypothetical protein [Trebonia sp.]